METTKLIVEYVVAGVIAFLALIFLTFSIFPMQVPAIANTILRIQSPIIANNLIATLIFLSVIYALGVIFEYLGLISFEWLLNRIKSRRFPIFIKQNRTWLATTTLFRSINHSGEYKSDRKTAHQLYGEMRFFIISEKASLRIEIESQINRFRLIRVLFLVEILIIISLAFQLFYNPTQIGIWALVIVFSISIANFFAIKARFERYCRSIERAYKVLALDTVTLPEASRIKSGSGK